MCLALIAWNVVPGHRLILASNRDEFHWRRTEPLHQWNDSPIVAGRDCAGGGTWVGTTATGSVGLVTNVRNGLPLPSKSRRDAPDRSRGLLISDYLESPESATSFARQLEESATRYAPFNLMVGDGEELVWVSNYRQFTAQSLAPGFYGLSNAELDSDWPKVQRGKAEFQRHLELNPPGGGPAWESVMFNILGNQLRPDDEELPYTHVPRQIERMVSPRFVQAGVYGTRASTLVDIPDNGFPRIVERRFGLFGRRLGNDVAISADPGRATKS